MDLKQSIIGLAKRYDSGTSSVLGAPVVSVQPGRSRELRYFLACLVSLSVGAASIENGLYPIFSLPSIPLIFAALLRTHYGRPFLLPERAVAALFLLYVVSFFAAINLLQGTVVLPVFMVYFTFGTLIARTLTPLTDRNLAQLIFLSLGMILINCILTSHMIFGLILPLYFFLLMGTLLLFHLARNNTRSSEVMVHLEKKRVSAGWRGKFAKYTVAILVFTIIVFVFVPRPFLVFPGLRGALSASGSFGDLQPRITYKDMVNTANPNMIAFTVNVEKGTLPSSPYWRGRVLDKNDSSGWHSTVNHKPMMWFIQSDAPGAVVYQILPYRLKSRTVYVAGVPLVVTGRMNKPLFITSSGEVAINSPFLYSDSYTVTSVARPIPADRRVESAYLDRAGTSPRIEELAQQWTSGSSSPRDKAGILVSKLRSQLRYKLRPPSPPEDVNPLEHFLFESKIGNCEYFAGALCLMLRSLGIPARIVEGFAGAERTSDPDQFIVRFSSAHAWVEALLDNANWTALDATPEVRSESPEDYIWRLLTDLYSTAEYKWVKHVVYFDRSDQLLMFERLGDMFSRTKGGSIRIPPGFGPALAGIALVVIGFLMAVFFVSKRRKDRDPAVVYLRTMKALAGKGILKQIHPWQEQNVREAIQSFPKARDPLTKFMDLYLKARFDPGRSNSVQSLEAARQELLRAVDRATK